MHLAAGRSFRHRRSVLIGWPPLSSPAEASQMNASRTVAFASLAPTAAAQDVPASARTTSMPGTAGPWTSKPTGGQQPSAPPARAIAITSIGTGTARIALL
jgi:hypothetical protein